MKQECKAASYSNLTPKMLCTHICSLFSTAVQHLMLSTWYISHISLLFLPILLLFSLLLLLIFRPATETIAAKTDSKRNQSESRPFATHWYERIKFSWHFQLARVLARVSQLNSTFDLLTFTLSQSSKIHSFDKQFVSAECRLNFCGQMLIVTNKSRSTKVNSFSQSFVGPGARCSVRGLPKPI